jgi:hypothetical protein
MVALDTRTIVEAIENSDRLLPHIPGHCEYATVSGVLTCITPANDPAANKAMLARLNTRSADESIRAVRSYFSSRRKPFRWIVGPSTTPVDLGERILAQGAEVFMQVDGLCLPDRHIDIKPNPAIRVVELAVTESEAATEVMAAGFGITLDSARYFHQMMVLSTPQLRMRVYAAYLNAVADPVACGYVSYYPDQPIALLCGGATLPDYRGRGVYKAVLAKRLNDIRKDGVQTVIVLADQRTSAPICAKAGFTKVCELQMYGWRQDDESAAG